MNANDYPVIAGLHPAVGRWFTSSFAAPSLPQLMGWPVIRAGKNALILAATGSGKTLAAFLEVLNRMIESGTGQGVQVVYVSPLKALNNDVARNLLEPLRGIAATAREMGLQVPEIQVAVRTGDTPESARRAMLRRPPDILITTPESLYLMLTAPKARQILATTNTVIVDEIHALAANKRGVHLSLSLERLEALSGRSLQRIGLSATQRPLERIARFLGGQVDGRPRPVEIIDARQAKRMELTVEMGPESMILPSGSSVWPDIYAKVLRAIESHRSTLVFVNTRALAEKVAQAVNELAGADLCRTHHGSLARSAREEVEAALKAGALRALVCTSSLELGIDIGAVDLVVQIASPRSVSSGLQRVGRSGHVLGAASHGLILAKSSDDLLDAAWVARAMRKGEVEETHVPENCLDVLAQHIVSMTAAQDWSLTELFNLVRRSYCYRNLRREQLLSVVEMLAGRYPARDFVELRPKVAWDRNSDTLHSLPGTRAQAVAGVGTIPDRAYYQVYIAGHDAKIGELEEEFVFESRPGDAFILGNNTWRIESITNNRVTVTPAPGAVPKWPFWKGEKGGRDYETGGRIGAFWRELADKVEAGTAVPWLTAEAAVAEETAQILADLVADQLRHTNCMPSDRCLLVESYIDEAGDYRIVLHSPYGARVHAAWEIAARRRVRDETGYELVSVSTDYGIAWHLPRGQAPPPLESLVYLGDEIEEHLMAELPTTALFGAYFRMNAARSLVLGRSSARRRIPLWLQRIKAGELLSLARKESAFPVALETFRECLHDVLDVPGLIALQQQLAAGKVRVEHRQTAIPSPLARAFILQLTGANMYEDDTPRAERKAQFLALDRDLLQQLLGEEELRHLLDPEAIASTVARRQHLLPDRQARTVDEAEELLLDVGDLAFEEVAARAADPGLAGELLAAGRAARRAFPVAPAERIVAAEEAALYDAAYRPDSADSTAARLFILKRFARTRGPVTVADVTARYGWDAAAVEALLAQLTAEGLLLSGAYLPGGSGVEWCHRDALQEIHRRTMAALRRQVEAVGAPAFTRHLLAWQGVGRQATSASLSQQVEECGRVLEQLAGLFLPVEVWERDVLPARLPGYDPAWLDLLCAQGRFVWAMQPGGANVGRGRLAFFSRQSVAALLPLFTPADAAPLSDAARELEEWLRAKGAAFATEIVASGAFDRRTVTSALWELALAGRVTNDSFAPVRRGQSFGLADGGRWSLLPRGDEEQQDGGAERQPAVWELLADTLLKRWGVVCRVVLAAEGLERYWPELQRCLRQMEMVGRVRGGYFVAGLDGAQFAHIDAVEHLRAARQPGVTKSPPLLLNACDPACVYGPLFPSALRGNGAFARSPLNYAVLMDRMLVLYISGFGRSLWCGADATAEQCAEAVKLLPQLLSIPGHQRPRRALAVATINGEPVLTQDLAPVLASLGFARTGDSMVLWPSNLRRPAASQPGSVPV